MPTFKRGTSPTPARSTYWILVICGLAIVSDGYDMIVYGVTVPSLLAYKPWNIGPAEVGYIGSLALVGMLIGSLVVGTITDVFGRRRVMIMCLSWFSIGMVLTSLAPNPEIFGALRFATGLGLGGVVPTAIALTIEYSPEGRRQLNNALMFSGFSIGGVLATLIALVVLPVSGFRVMFLIGVFPLILVLPMVVLLLPESISHLAAKGKFEEAKYYAKRFGVPLPQSASTTDHQKTRQIFASVHVMLSGGRAVVSILVWIVSILGLLLVYGLNTWLPQVMRQSGYSMGSTLTFFLVFNLGAVLGVIVAGAIADRIGEKAVISGAFGVAALAVLLFALQPVTALLLVLGAVAGFGSNTQTLVNAFIGGLYPPRARATALGWALGVGRLGAILGPTYGGFIVIQIQAGSLSDDWSYYAFVIPALVAAVLTVMVRRPERGRGVSELSDESTTPTSMSDEAMS